MGTNRGQNKRRNQLKCVYLLAFHIFDTCLAKARVASSNLVSRLPQNPVDTGFFAVLRYFALVNIDAFSLLKPSKIGAFVVKIVVNFVVINIPHHIFIYGNFRL